MATTFVIACPECAKQVKVSDEHVGKKIRCKQCGHIFPVQAAGDGPKPSAPKTKAAPPAPPKAKGPSALLPPAPAPSKPAHHDDDDDGPRQYGLQETNDNLPRCPFCAQEMPSEDALICLNCGYNTRTRMRPEVKAVYEVTGGEQFLWLLPGILCVVTMLGLIVWYLVFYTMIEDWMAGGWFEDEPGPPRTWMAGLSPGMFRLYHGLMLAFMFVPLIRFAYKRLVVDNKPREQSIREE
jgi:predicted Zn finger-like uncharacterized protein